MRSTLIPEDPTEAAGISGDSVKSDGSRILPAVVHFDRFVRDGGFECQNHVPLTWRRIKNFSIRQDQPPLLRALQGEDDQR